MTRECQKKFVTGFASLLLTVCVASPVYAITSTTLPTGSSVQSGNVTVNSAGAAMTVTQTTSTGIINWDTYSIGSSASVNYVQPTTSSITLNRVTGTQASQIYGKLTANGKIVLVNGNGIYFGPNSVVNVGGIIATTSAISNADFNAVDPANGTGTLHFTPGTNVDAWIVNASKNFTVADGGLALLLGPQVSNNSTGVITAKYGKVQLGGGDTFTVDLYGDGLISVEASDALKNHLISVNNNGKIYANGGEVLMTAAAASGLIASEVNLTGLIQADSIDNVNGQIVLSGDDVNVYGKLYARGETANNETGGTITVKGKDVELCNCTRMDATGVVGGNGTGQITIIADRLEAEKGISIKTNENIRFEPYSDSTNIEVAGTYEKASTKLQVTKDLLDDIEAGSVTIGNTDRDTGTLTAHAYDWNAPVEMLNHDGDIVIDGQQNMGDKTFLANTQNGNIVLETNGGVSSSASGDAIVLAASNGAFTNKNGSTALQATGADGRWLVYSETPENDTFGNLDSDNTAVWGKTYSAGSTVPQTGNRYVFAVKQVVTVTPDDMAAKPYGQDYTTQVANDTYNVDYKYKGYTGAFKDDTEATALSGSVALTSAGAPSSATPGTYDINVSGVTPNDGYELVVIEGKLPVSGTIDFPEEAIDRSKAPGRKGPAGTLLSIANNTLTPPAGSLQDLAPAAGGDGSTYLADLAPAAGGGNPNGITPLIQCNEATPCDINQ